MDLYIRSQDKMNLVKINQVNVNYQNNNQIIANYIPDFVGTQGEYYETLGTYDAKERALEVLDEIEKIIYINKLFNADIGAFQTVSKNEGYTEKEISEFLKKISVYEMPKE